MLLSVVCVSIETGLLSVVSVCQCIRQSRMFSLTSVTATNRKRVLLRNLQLACLPVFIKIMFLHRWEDFNWIYVYLQVSPSSHSIVCLLSCRPFVTFVTSSAGLSSLGRQKKLRQPRPFEDVTKVTKGVQERRQLIEWDDGETCKQG